MKKKFFSLILLVTFVLSIPAVLFAQGGGSTAGDPEKIVNPLGPNGADNLNDFIKKILEGIIKIGIPIIALAIVYCGFLFIQARGNSKELETAKQALIYTIIGAAILLGAWALSQLISDTVLSL
ncbi:MAG: TrbC/VirB2 family protein [Patescibacteria group bacterium]